MPMNQIHRVEDVLKLPPYLRNIPLFTKEDTTVPIPDPPLPHGVDHPLAF